MSEGNSFIGRRRELQMLEAAYASTASAFVPVYGRRRVGKSELILRFLRGKPSVYYVGKQATPSMQMHELLLQAASSLEEPLLAGYSTSNWKTTLTAIVDRWRGPGKLVLALDEFQWTAAASPELPSVLQELWDRQWRASGSIVLILCGSMVGFMEREVLGKSSPLFGRRTGQIALRPFGYQEAAEFHPTLSTVERARTYFICGGIPLYLRCFSPSCSVETNIAATLLNEFAPLYREPEFLLREELREVETYYAVLMALASGSATNKMIAAETGIGERGLHYYLQQLVELGYVARGHPLIGRLPAARHVRYSLDDPLLRFWFRFVYPNISLIHQRGAQQALRDRIRPGLEAYYGQCFERLCREALPVLYDRENVAASFQVGEYWDKTTQIDVVGYRDDGWTDLGECKWGAVRSIPRLREELEGKVRAYPNSRGATIGRRLFIRTRAHADSRLSGPTLLHTLQDLY